jgi:hypothetical protein
MDIGAYCSGSNAWPGSVHDDPMNAINVISPYKHIGMWVFDDARVGLMQEPFVAGADTLIDGRRILLAFASSEAQAKRYAKQAEVKYGLKKTKKKK